MSYDTSSYEFEIDHLYSSSGELVIVMKQKPDDKSESPANLYINTNKANEFVCDKRFLNAIDGFFIDGEKDIKIQKPSLIERINKESIIFSIADIAIKATDDQFNYLLDYINKKKTPLPEPNSEIKADNDISELNKTMREILKELKKINKKLNHIGETITDNSKS